MELRLTGTNIEISPEVRRYVVRKVGKLNRHFPNILESRVEISEEKTKSPEQRYFIHLTVDASGAVFHAEERAEDQLKAIDKVAATMIRQLENHKGKLYDKSRTSAMKRDEIIEETLSPEEEPKVVKVKNFIIKPMTLLEAIDQMELLGHDFFLFHDSETERMKLVYRRKDGNYGLIEPKLG